MTEWKMDTGHMARLNVLGVYEQGTELDDLFAEKLGHLLPKCRPCGINAAVAMLDAQGVAPDETADLTRAEILRQVQELGPEKLQQWAKEEADELLAMDADERYALLAHEPDSVGFPHLVDELVERCRAQVTKDPRRALELAELAVEVSLRVDSEIFHDLAFHARARAEAHRGNCLRLCDETSAAAQAFGHAKALYDYAEGPEPEVAAELHRLEASLCIDQRRFGEAEALLHRALILYRQLGDERFVGLTLLKRAHAAYQRGEPTQGLGDLGEALQLLGPADHSRHYTMVCFNLSLYAVEAGHLNLARRYLSEHQQLFEERNEAWFVLRFRWLRAKLARVEGNLNSARDLYAQTFDGFVTENMGYDAALVAVELALLHLEIGDTKATAQLASKMLPIFKAQDVHREALAALALFQEAARTDALSVTLVRRLRRYLQLARQDPTFKLEDFLPEA